MNTSLRSLIRYLQHQRLVIDYIFISAASTLIYDYFLTLHLEIELIWFSPWKYTKVVFLVFRYMPFIQIIISLRNQTSINVSAGTCKATFPVEPFLAMFQMTLAEVILAIRTSAIWNRNKAVDISLIVLILGSLVPQCVFLHMFIRSLDYKSPPYQEFRGCYITKVSRILKGSYAISIVIEATFVALMLTSAIRSHRRGSTSRFLFVIHRDGILFYVYLLCISIANLAVMIFLPHDMFILLTPLECALYSVLATRIVFDIRDMWNRKLQADLELRTRFHESPQAIPLSPVPPGPHTANT